MSRFTSIIISLCLISYSFSLSGLETAGVDALSFTNSFVFGLTNENLTECYPPNFLQYTGANVSYSSFDKNPFQNSTTDLQKILHYVSDGVSVVCSIKTFILKLFKGDSQESISNSLKSDYSSTSNYIKKFQNGRRRRMLWWWDDVIHAADSGLQAVESVGNDVKNGVVSVGNDVKNGVVSVGNDVKNGVVSVGNDVKNGVESVGNDVKNGVVSVGNDVKNGVESVGNDAIKLTQKIFHEAADDGKKALGLIVDVAQKVKSLSLDAINDVKDIIDKVIKLIQNIKTFYDSPDVQRIKSEILRLKECAPKLEDVVKKIRSLIKNFEKTIKSVETLGDVGLAKLGLNLVCEYQSFVPAIEALIHGIRSHGQARFEDFGYFLGKIISIIGDA